MYKDTIWDLGCDDQKLLSDSGKGTCPFPNLKVYLLMGNVAIKVFNYISKRQIGKNTIPAGSTIKSVRVNFIMRAGAFFLIFADREEF